MQLDNINKYLTIQTDKCVKNETKINKSLTDFTSDKVELTSDLKKKITTYKDDKTKYKNDMSNLLKVALQDFEEKYKNLKSAAKSVIESDNNDLSHTEKCKAIEFYLKVFYLCEKKKRLKKVFEKVQDDKPNDKVDNRSNEKVFLPHIKNSSIMLEELMKYNVTCSTKVGENDIKTYIGDNENVVGDYDFNCGEHVLKFHHNFFKQINVDIPKASCDFKNGEVDCEQTQPLKCKFPNKRIECFTNYINTCQELNDLVADNSDKRSLDNNEQQAVKKIFALLQGIHTQHFKLEKKMKTIRTRKHNTDCILLSLEVQSKKIEEMCVKFEKKIALSLKSNGNFKQCIDQIFIDITECEKPTTNNHIKEFLQKLNALCEILEQVKSCELQFLKASTEVQNKYIELYNDIKKHGKKNWSSDVRKKFQEFKTGAELTLKTHAAKMSVFPLEIINSGKVKREFCQMQWDCGVQSFLHEPSIHRQLFFESTVQNLENKIQSYTNTHSLMTKKFKHYCEDLIKILQ